MKGAEEGQGVPIKRTLDGYEFSESYENSYNPVQKFLLQSISKAALTVEQGANTQIFLAAGADSKGDLAKGGGKYYVDMEVAKAMPFSINRELASRLWQVSETLTGTKITI